MEYDWDKVPDVDDFNPLPDGWYDCRLTRATVKQDRDGHQYISLEFTVIAGNYEGRKLFDNLHFKSEESLKRAKAVCMRIGLRMKGTFEIDPIKHLLDKRVFVKAEGSRKYTTSEGEEREINNVPYMGYRQVGTQVDTNTSDLPF